MGSASASVQNLQLAGGTGQTSQNGGNQQHIQQQLGAKFMKSKECQILWTKTYFS